MHGRREETIQYNKNYEVETLLQVALTDAFGIYRAPRTREEVVSLDYMFVHGSVLLGLPRRTSWF